MTLASDVTTQYYVTSVVLTPGVTYQFKVSARNTVGSGSYSVPISILAAKTPYAPLSLANVPSVTTAYLVGLDWTQGVYNGGSPVVDYQISYKQATDDSYIIFASGVTTTSSSVFGLTPG